MRGIAAHRGRRRSAFFLVSLLLGDPASDGFVFAIGVTVALVPEALLPTVTLSLAWGAEQMAKRQVLVRNLEAVETLGSTTFICTDKTGTLTHNQMTVVEAWTPAGSANVERGRVRPRCRWTSRRPGRRASVRLARGGARCSTGYASRQDGEWRAHGDPMEAALDVFARRLGVDTGRRPVRGPGRSVPVRPAPAADVGRDRRRGGGQGAPDAVLPLLRRRPGAAAALLPSPSGAAGARGGPPSGRDRPGDCRRSRDDLRLLGLVALEDPPRHDVRRGDRRLPPGRVKVADDHRRPPGDGGGHRHRGRPARPDGPVLVGDELPDDQAARRPARPRRRRRRPGLDPRTSSASPGRCGPAATSWR